MSEDHNVMHPTTPEQAQEDLVRCDVTGVMVPREDTVEFQGQTVSAEGKAVLLARLRDTGHDPLILRHAMVRPSFWRRLLCSMLDSVVITGVCIPFVILFLFDLDMENHSTTVVFQMVLFMGLISFGYYTFMHAKYGKSVGKMAGGFRVVNLDGTPISLRASAIRAFWSNGVLLIASLLLFLSPIIGMIMNWVGSLYNMANCITLVADSRENRAIHDRMAGTRVIMDNR